MQIIRVAQYGAVWAVKHAHVRTHTYTICGVQYSHVCGHPCCVLSPVYAPLRELIEGLPEAQRQRWERLWMVSDARLDRVHPLIYSHPVTGEKVRLDQVCVSVFPFTLKLLKLLDTVHAKLTEM